MTGAPRTLPLVQPEEATRPAPPFEKIAVFGLGLIGGSIALAARRTWPRILVIGVDANEVLEAAMRLHVVDVGADEPFIAAEADLVVLAAPVRENVRLLEVVAAHVQGPAVVTDVGSTKRAIVEAAAGLPARLTFVGGHPLAGATESGLAHARADLFAGRPWILTPHDEASGPAVERLAGFVQALGAVPRLMSPAAHDRLVAFLSHLPQLAATALMDAVGEEVGEDGLALAGRGLIDTTRLAASPASVWRDICATNADELRRALDALIARLDELRRGLESDETIERFFSAANHWRARLPRGESAGPR